MWDVFRHIDRRLAETTIKVSPYPHISVSEILPANLYESMLADTPSRDAFLTEMHTTEYFGRFEFSPSPEQRDVALLWHERYHPVIAHLNGALTAKFGPFIAIHLRRLAEHGVIRDATPALKLGQTSCCYMRNGWTLPVDTHSLGQIMQSFVYFPVSDDPAELGTMMCRFKHSMPWHGDADAVQAYSIDEEIEDVAAAPYAANQLFAFLNTPNSPHRVPAVAGAPDRRYVFTQNTLTPQALANPTRPIRSDAFRFDLAEMA